VVLAGGKSTRFGSNKALIEYDGKTFLQQIIERLQPFAKEVVIAGFHPEYELVGIPVLADKMEGIGPLGGIYTALTYSTTPWILVMTCDMPLVTDEIIAYMITTTKGEDVTGWKQSESGGLFPLLISKNILPYVEEMIENKQYSVKQIFNLISSNILTIPAKWRRFFVNINNQEEYKQIIINQSNNS
jgi:molybdopterin-guanine dinucleotide biosynthesis protein A